ncbi:amino acid ABC transporter substrate-binding protein [Pseudoalteromonas sp. JBTF-M23]|uniref:Amino acid ABC transporter substrate-binding protein n=1 Tax=Pseudoalteromonas caenipelagi TaxID=2726988 RepID=A0A849VKV0_9GAMM|nr:transporter substrate-binding domain-containing protein [Pseudoalteromonas caenipelagi]NOU52237.1 amino acid ABC transporter substrate-binding protein [Pseudoalteromonas caenipelagi]
MKVWLLLLLFLASSAFAQKYTVLVYHGANPPYSFKENDKVVGIFTDIFARLAQLTGHEFEFVATSVARGQRFFDSGQVDIEPGVSMQWRIQQKVPGIYTITYAKSVEILLGNNANTLEDVSQAYGSLVGRVRGYRYGAFESHFDEDKLIVYDNISEKELLGQLAYGRLDYVLIGKDTAHYYMANNPAYRHFKDAYIIETAKVAMRLQPHLTDLKEQLNTALTTMVNNQEIAAIYKKYTDYQH